MVVSHLPLCFVLLAPDASPMLFKAPSKKEFLTITDM